MIYENNNKINRFTKYDFLKIPQTTTGCIKLQEVM